MKAPSKCQEYYVYDLAEDLDVILDAHIEIMDFDCRVTLRVNDTEIEIEGEIADKIYKALEVRIKNYQEEQMNDIIEWSKEQSAIDAYEEKMRIDQEGWR